jgi:nuclear transcription factor Y gamma
MDLKQQVLPLARIKKIMKLDEDVKMISAEAPLLFAKAAEIFIQELTLRAWIHTEDNKRRTLQRNDIAMAISKYDQFDFLIDIVPRDDMKPAKPREDATRSSGSDQVYYFQLAQQHHANLQQNTPTTAAASPTSVTQAQGAIQIVQPQQVQTVQVKTIDQVCSALL